MPVGGRVERDVVLRAAAEVADEQLVRVRVEDPEAVVAARDRDVAPDRDVRVRPPRRRVAEAVVEPHVRAVRCGRGLDRKDAGGEREQDEEPAGGGHASVMLMGSVTRY